MKRIAIVFILLFLFKDLYSQKNKEVFSFGTGIQKVRSQNEIIFFGYDMSSLKCTVKQKDMSDFALCTRIPGEIINWLNARYGTKKIRRKIGVKTLTFENASIQLRLKDLEQNCLTTEMYTISEAKLQEIVKSYTIPDKYDGKVGFVTVVENLNRMRGSKGYATTFFVFFDCSTKEILYACHSYGNDAGGNNMRTFWGEAIEKAYKKFYRKI